MHDRHDRHVWLPKSISCDLFPQWINPYTVVAMDTGERIHLISAKTDAEVEVRRDIDDH